MSIKLINALRLYISLIKRNIDNEKNLKITPPDSSIKNKEIAFCAKLLFGILSFTSYLDIGSMNITSSSVEINEYKLLNIRSLGFMYAFMKLINLDHLRFHKYLVETGYDFVDFEFIVIYHELEVYITIKSYKNTAKPLIKLKN